jgi:hypothetical protein
VTLKFLKIITLTVLPFVFAGCCTSRLHTAYIVPAGTLGNQQLPPEQTQSMGNDFDVNTTIEVTSIGVFDSGGAPLIGTLHARIFNRDTQQSVVDLIFTREDPGNLVGSSRFKPLAKPLLLQKGFHGVISVSYLGTDELEPDGNLREGPGDWTTDSAGGAISFVGMGRHSWMGTGDAFPDIVDPSTAPNNFAAGTFTYRVVGKLP